MRAFIQYYIIPVIQFVNAIKKLLESEIDEKTFEWKQYFAEYLGFAQDVIEFLVKVFAKAAKALCPPDVITATVYKQIILQFANYVKTLEKRQRNFLYFKIASVIVNATKAKRLKNRNVISGCNLPTHTIKLNLWHNGKSIQFYTFWGFGSRCSLSL